MSEQNDKSAKTGGNKKNINMEEAKTIMEETVKKDLLKVSSIVVSLAMAIVAFLENGCLRIEANKAKEFYGISSRYFLDVSFLRDKEYVIGGTIVILLIIMIFYNEFAQRVSKVWGIIWQVILLFMLGVMSLEFIFTYPVYVFSDRFVIGSIIVVLVLSILLSISMNGGIKKDKIRNIFFLVSFCLYILLIIVGMSVIATQNITKRTTYEIWEQSELEENEKMVETSKATDDGHTALKKVIVAEYHDYFVVMDGNYDDTLKKLELVKGKYELVSQLNKTITTESFYEVSCE